MGASPRHHKRKHAAFKTYSLPSSTYSDGCRRVAARLPSGNVTGMGQETVFKTPIAKQDQKTHLGAYE